MREDSINSEIVPSSESQQDGKRPWSPKLIVIITILFSILPGGILYALNYERLGLAKKKVPNLITFTLLFIVVFLFKITNQDKPIGLITFFLGLYCAVHFYKTQNQLYKTHILKGGKRENLFLPLMVVLISTSLILGTAYSIDNIVTKKYFKAIELIDEGNYREAEPNINLYKRFNKEDEYVHYNLAIIYSETGREELAKEEIKTFLRKNPDDSDAKHLLEELNNKSEKN